MGEDSPQPPLGLSHSPIAFMFLDTAPALNILSLCLEHALLLPSWQIPVHPSVCSSLGVAAPPGSFAQLLQAEKPRMGLVQSSPLPLGPCSGLADRELPEGREKASSALPNSSSPEDRQTRFPEVKVLPS